MSTRTKGTLIALVGIAIWSTSGVLISFILTNYPISSLALAFWRNFIITLFLFPILLIFRRRALRFDRKHLLFTLLYGCFLGVFNSVWVLSVNFNGAAVATVLAYSSAGFTAVFAYFIFREKITIHKIIAIILSMTGSIMVSKAYLPEMWQVNAISIVIGLVSGAFFAGYTLFGKASLQRQIDPWGSMFYTFLIGAIFILVLSQFRAIPGAPATAAEIVPALGTIGWLWMIFLSIGPTLLGFGLYNVSMMFIPASVTNLLATSEPAMTAVQAYFFLGERLNWVQILGSFIILSAVIIIQFSKIEE